MSENTEHPASSPADQSAHDQAAEATQANAAASDEPAAAASTRSAPSETREGDPSSPDQSETPAAAQSEKLVPDEQAAGEQAAGEQAAGEQAAGEQAADEQPAHAAGSAAAGKAGPISLERIRELRLSQQKADATRSPSKPKPKPQGVKPNFQAAAGAGSKPLKPTPDKDKSRAAKGGDAGQFSPIPTPPPVGTAPRIAVPSRRQALSQDLEDELSAALGESDLDKMLVGDSMLQVGLMLEEGQRLQAKVMKAHGEFVFVSLGGANEGVLPSLQFEELPALGSQLDVIVRGYLAQEGLYELTMPGNAVQVADWSDIKEGEVVEAVITAANAGGLECKVGSIRGFIPASQAAEFRIEDLSEFVDQKVLCVVTEANERRGNLVLSRRAVLEREKKEKRAERLASLEVGSAVEGVVRKITDFGAFVDIGGLDGLLHISQLSWERVAHPSEILQEGQKVQVRVDKIDEQSGKIGLSYRSLQEHPWTDIDTRFPVGTIIHGHVTRIAEFGAFVRVATGVEGLIHVSELAHHRVHNVSSVVSEGQEVDVKILSIDLEQQRMGLSLKAAQAAPEATTTSEAAGEESADEEARPEPVLPKHRGPLKGGTGRPAGGDQFGLKW